MSWRFYGLKVRDLSKHSEIFKFVSTAILCVSFLLKSFTDRKSPNNFSGEKFAVEKFYLQELEFSLFIKKYFSSKNIFFTEKST